MRRAYPLPRLIAGALRALIDLGTARIALTRIKPNGVLDRNRRNAARLRQGARHIAPASVAQSCDDTAFFITRMANRVPWRSDCLVQALAGQQWLAREGIPSEIVVGTSKPEGGVFESHAWLRQADRIVLGGDIGRFVTLLEPDAATGERDL